MENPKLTIAIPVYNTDATLKKCLDSAVNQTLHDIEIICVDDGSEDDSAKILAEYARADKRIKIITHDINQGPLTARNSAIEIAVGKYILFLDSDDYLESEACEKLYQRIEKEKADIFHYGIIVEDYYGYDEKGYRDVCKWVTPYEGKLQKGEILEKCFIDRQYCWNLCGKIFRTDIVKRILKYVPDQKITVAEDALQYFFIAAKSSSYIGDPSLLFYHYCVGLGGTKRIADLKRFRQLCERSVVLTKIEEFCEKESLQMVYRRMKSLFWNSWAKNCIDVWDQLADHSFTNKLSLQDEKEAWNLLLDSWGKELIIQLLHTKYKNPYQLDRLTKRITPVLSEIESKKPIKRIALYYHRMYFGGAERVNSLLCNVFLKLGYEVLIVTDEGPTVQDYEIPSNVPHVSISPRHNKLTEKNIHERLKCWSDIYDEYPFEAVLYSAWGSNILICDCLYLKLKGILTIVHAHGIFTWKITVNQKLQPFFWAANGIIDRIVTLSETNRAFWGEINPNTYYIPNPIDKKLQNNPQIEKPNKNIIWVGRFNKEKRTEDAVRIMAEIHKRDPQAVLYMVGDGTPSINDLKELSKRLKCEDSIVFVGYTEDVYGYYEKASILLCTSLYEGFPMTWIEGQSFGLPIVSYRLPYLSIRGKECGVLEVDPLNIAQAADAVIVLLNDHEFWETLHQNACKSFSNISSFSQEAAWKDVLEGNRPNKNETGEKEVMIETIINDYSCGKELYREREIKREKVINRDDLIWRDQQYEEIKNSFSFRLGNWFVRKIPERIRKVISRAGNMIKTRYQ